MADNYLEKQREQYEARKAAWERAKKLGKVKKTTSKPRQPEPRPEEKQDSCGTASVCRII